MNFDDVVHGTCNSAVLILALNACFCGGGIAIALLSKHFADGARHDLEEKFMDIAIYFNDWDLYLSTFETIYGTVLMIYGIVVASLCAIGALAFWFRVRVLVVPYMIFIIVAILAEYAVGAVLVIYQNKDHFPFFSGQIEGEIMDGLDNGSDKKMNCDT